MAETTLIHPRLISFFAKYPPKLYGAHFTGQTIPTLRTRVATGAKALSSTNVPTIPTETEPETESVKEDTAPNPFLPYRNPATGRWRGAKVGLRQQADLFKIARQYGLEELLPASRKSSAFKELRILERGMKMKGTGEGETVKGHKWERTMHETIEKRRKAMEEMPEMIRLWKQQGHGRGWKKYPK